MENKKDKYEDFILASFKKADNACEPIEGKFPPYLKFVKLQRYIMLAVSRYYIERHQHDPDPEESDQFYMANHHEAIVTVEQWEQANAILKKRSYVRRLNPDGTRVRFSRQYSFSSIVECGFCGHPLCRRAWRSGKNYEKIIWQCAGYSKKGKCVCPDSKGFPEEELKNAFVDAYNRIIGGDATFLERFIRKSEDYLKRSNLKTLVGANKKALQDVQDKIDRIGCLYADGTLSKDAYDDKYKDFAIEKGDRERMKVQSDLIDVAVAVDLE